MNPNPSHTPSRKKPRALPSLLVALLLLAALGGWLSRQFGDRGSQADPNGPLCIEMGNPAHPLSDDHFSCDPAHYGYTVLPADERLALLLEEDPQREIAATIVSDTPLDPAALPAEAGAPHCLYLLDDAWQVVPLRVDGSGASLPDAVIAFDTVAPVSQLAKLRAYGQVVMVDPHWIENPEEYRSKVGRPVQFKSAPIPPDLVLATVPEIRSAPEAVFYDSSLTGEAVPIAFAEVQAGRGMSWGLTSAGELYVWGNNAFGAAALQPWGDPLRRPDDSLPVVWPHRVATEHPVIEASVHSNGICLALDASGNVYRWGTTWFDHVDWGGSGRLYRHEPTAVPLPEKAVRLLDGGGSIGAVVGESGAVYVWGWNRQGQLADGTTEERDLPQKLAVDGVTALSARSTHVLALTEAGTVLSWGGNNHGELGRPPEEDTLWDDHAMSHVSPTPHTVPLPERAVQVETGYGTSYALGASGAVYSWGCNEVGQLGRASGDASDHPAPAVVPLPQKITAIHAGESFAIAVGADGTLYGWGQALDALPAGEAGAGEPVQPVTRQPVALATGELIAALSVGSDHVIARTANGRLLGWGSNIGGILGVGQPEHLTEPVELQFHTVTVPVPAPPVS
ncbi:MAG: hypothetical protein IJC43_00625 [Clostridia bacterium]|nr:hypothetical protein [Clostridia bacterium]